MQLAGAPLISILSLCALLHGGYVIADTANAPVSESTLSQAREQHGAGDYQSALDLYEQALKEDIPAADTATAHNNACVIAMNFGNYRPALRHCQRAVELRRSLALTRRLARSLNNLALVNQHLGNFDEAKQIYEQALNINTQLADSHASAVNLSNLGMLATEAGQYSHALRYLEESQALASKHHEADWAGTQMQLSRLNQAVVMERVSAFEAARGLYQEVAEQRDALDAWGNAALEVNRGVVYRNLGDPHLAIERFEDARQRYEELGARASLSNVYLNIALAYMYDLGQPAQASTALNEALSLAQQAEDHNEQINDHFYLGELALRRSQFALAQPHFTQSLSIAVKTGAGEKQWPAQFGLGEVARQQGRHVEALRAFALAIEDIERVREDITRLSLREGYFDDKGRVYQAAIASHLVLADRGDRDYHTTQAFALAQQAKARVLMDLLGAESTSIAGQRLSQMPALGGLQTQLLRGAHLLEYLVVHERLIRFVLTGSGLNATDLGPLAPIATAISRVHQAFASGQAVSAEQLQQLSGLLLPDLPEIGTESTLWIGLDGPLWQVPFSALPDAGGHPLLERYALAYLPSAAFLATRSEANVTSEHTFAGLADPTPPQQGPLYTQLIAHSGFALAPLPAARASVDAISAERPDSSMALYGDAASESALRRVVQRGTRILHLGTHALIDNVAKRAVVLLSADDEHDGILYAAELARMDMRVGLAVLAACQTAYSPDARADAFSTLTGALLGAGAQSTVATLWAVDDAVTAAFMRQFYYFLEKGESVGQALRHAKQRLREDADWREPAVWSAYVLIGNASYRPLPGARGTQRLPLLATALTLLIGLAGLYLHRRRSRPPA